MNSGLLITIRDYSGFYWLIGVRENLVFYRVLSLFKLFHRVFSITDHQCFLAVYKLRLSQYYLQYYYVNI